MGTNVRQGIVTSGLTLHLDMANPLSYPGSGTSITSLLRNDVTGSISGSANISYSTATGNKAVFWNNVGINRTTGDITLNSDPFNVGSNPFTIEMVWYMNSIATSAGLSLATNADGTVAPAGYFVLQIVGSANPSTTGINLRNSTGNSLFAGASTFTTGRWNHICVTAARGGGNTTTLYVNGVVTRVGADPGNLPNTVGSSAIGRIVGGGSNINNPNGHMAITRFYNRALSATEVAQNYNAVKSRFNLP